MAQACNNIGKECPLTSKQVFSPSSSSLSASTPFVSKARGKSISPQDEKRTLKRSAPSTSPCPSLSPPTKKPLLNPVTTSSSSANPFSYPPSPLLLDSFLLHQLSKSASSTHLDFPFFPPSPFLSSFNSAFSPSSQRSTYLMNSILSSTQSSAFVCNWMDSNIPDGFCGKRFGNHIHLLEHLCTAHTFMSSMIASYPSFYPSTSLAKR